MVDESIKREQYAIQNYILTMFNSSQGIFQFQTIDYKSFPVFFLIFANYCPHFISYFFYYGITFRE